MDEIVDVRNVGNVCRLCLSTEEPKSSVFADDPFATVSLATKIQTCLSIEVLIGDKVSTLICANCLRRVNKWHAYKEYCFRSQQKLLQCLGDRSDNGISNIKAEPMDFSEPTSPLAPLTSEDDHQSITERRDESAGPIVSTDASAIKREAANDAENHNTTVELESVCSAELLLNPMAVVGHKEDRPTEVVSTKRSRSVDTPGGIKKKVRRGPHTHYRGLRQYKQRCSYCQIYLHSKSSYARHTERFHSGKIYARKMRGPAAASARAGNKQTLDDKRKKKKMGGKFVNAKEEGDMTMEMIEDVEDELISLEKDAPLTPVQQNIISQLKTFSCYSCRECFNDRRSTLNHIRQHMPDLRPYTCIACLTEFADRSIYKLHCGASFQCAMKIALVVPEHGTEKYFTCNMCLRSLPNRKELLSHLSRHSDKQYEQLIAGPFRSPPKLKPIAPLSASSPSSTKQHRKNPSNFAHERYRKIPGPYKNGDPAHNHACAHCGMIYRYKQNMLKHVSLCKKLPSDGRICYKCVNCGMTFLAFNKFHTHVSHEHKRKDLVCYRCDSKYKRVDDFLSHYREHCAESIREVVDTTGQTTDGAAHRDTERSHKVERWKSNVDEWNEDYVVVGTGKTRYSCALCPNRSFPTKNHLTEHKKLNHPKVTIYTCSVCRCSFGKSSILEAHMAVHATVSATVSANVSAIESEKGTRIAAKGNNARLSIKSDPGASNTECQTCGKVFANYPNLRRHIRTVHDAIGRFSCFTCAKTFVREQQWTEHVEKEHKHAERTVNCPQCPEVFESREAVNVHRRSIHGSNGEDHLACYICGKSFANETSLKIHRGHHFRVNSRLSLGNVRGPLRDNGATAGTLERERHDAQLPSEQRTLIQPVKSPRARKSFPNGITGVGQSQSAGGTLQCQVCDDRFNDVAELRKHLWDVHCARNKPEKPFISDKLQCELCTNVFPDEESLASHGKWHESNPILSERRETRAPAQCDLCGKFYSSVANLRKHKKRHKVGGLVVNRVQTVGKRKKKSSIGNGFTCNVCRKVFAERSTMMKHKAVAHPPQPSSSSSSSSSSPSIRQAGNSNSGRETIVEPEVIKPVRPKLDFDTLTSRDAFSGSGDGKKSPARDLCRKAIPDVRALYKHRRLVDKITNETTDSRSNFDLATVNDSIVVNRVSCTACSKLFSNVANMRQHFTKVHGTGSTGPGNHRSSQYRCSVDACKLTFKTLVAKQNHEKTHINVMYTCALCPRHMINPGAMAEHMLTAHKTHYPGITNEMTLCKKIDLDNYVVRGANGRQCPVCKITYPNNKALKVHYLKVHDGVA